MSGFHDAVMAVGTRVSGRWEGRRERRAAAASQRSYWQASRRSLINVPRVALPGPGRREENREKRRRRGRGWSKETVPGDTRANGQRGLDLLRKSEAKEGRGT